MNYIWDITVKARECGYDKEDIFFRQAEDCSPWYEQSFPCMNQAGLDGSDVEVNALYRFGRIFQALLHPDVTDFPEFRAFIFDMAIHLLCEADLRYGLTKREFYLRRLEREILGGGYGAGCAAAFGLIPALQRNRLSSLILRQLETGSSLLIFRKAVLVLFPEAFLYQVRVDKKQILLYLGQVQSEQRRTALEFVLEMFLPVSYRIRLFWEHHFGMIGVDATMRMNEIEIY